MFCIFGDQKIMGMNRIYFTIFSGKILLLYVAMMFMAASVALPRENDSRQDTSVNQVSNGRLAVFLDLQWGVDRDYIRQEIPVVDYVRDKELADVHIIISRHEAGQAGTNYEISLIGRGSFRKMDNTLRYWSPASQTDHESREGYTKMIKIGLAPYIASLESMPGKISLHYEVDSTSEMDQITTRVEDPWRSWVFEIYGGGYFDSEQTRNSTHIRYGFYADKVTKDWKIRARPYFNYNEDNYEVDDTLITNIRHRDGFDGYLIKSLSDHWSAGVFTQMLSSTYHNFDFQVEVSPAIEYSLFPYEEATRRAITVAYKLDYSYNDYEQKTIYGKRNEVLWGHSLVVAADFRQTWGTIRAGITGSQHFYDLSSNRAELFTRMDVRIFKGFSLTLRGDINFINDLVAIPMAEMTTEEILLERRRRSTNYELDGHIGFTYTFGSELSKAYNPRL